MYLMLHFHYIIDVCVLSNTIRELQYIKVALLQSLSNFSIMLNQDVPCSENMQPNQNGISGPLLYYIHACSVTHSDGHRPN